MSSLKIVKCQKAQERNYQKKKLQRAACGQQKSDFENKDKKKTKNMVRRRGAKRGDCQFPKHTKEA